VHFSRHASFPRASAREEEERESSDDRERKDFSKDFFFVVTFSKKVDVNLPFS